MTTTRTTTRANEREPFPTDRLLAWYREHGRHDLPWRRTRDPYAVLVSEVMLQQTQVDRVVPYYETWTTRWPDAVALAGSTPADVIRAWSGLGYNRRALNLHRAAVAVRDGFDGTVPIDPDVLRTLPGVGPYTAAAVASFAGEAHLPVVDTNIGRVVARHRGGVAAPRMVPARDLARAAENVLPTHGAHDFNLAMMDLGAMICTARGPACDECPVRQGCAWVAAGRPPGAPAVKRAPRFETTARFARGRLIDALRSVSPRSEAALAALLPDGHRRKTAEYLAALERDGLVERAGQSWALAGETPGSSNIASPKL